MAETNLDQSEIIADRKRAHGTDNDVELLACPFCGGHGLQIYDQEDGIRIECYRKGCNVSVLMDEAETVAEARTQWNTRATAAAPLDALMDKVEKLRKVGLGDYWNGQHDVLNEVVRIIKSEGRRNHREMQNLQTINRTVGRSERNAEDVLETPSQPQGEAATQANTRASLNATTPTQPDNFFIESDEFHAPEPPDPAAEALAKELAETIIEWCGNRHGHNVFDRDVSHAAKVITAALQARDERAARIVETVDLTGWVKNGGRLREVIAAAIRSKESSDG